MSRQTISFDLRNLRLLYESNNRPGDYFRLNENYSDSDISKIINNAETLLIFAKDEQYRRQQTDSSPSTGTKDL